MCAPNVIGSYLQVRVAGHVCTVVVQRGWGGGGGVQRGWGGGSAKRLGGGVQRGSLCTTRALAVRGFQFD